MQPKIDYYDFGVIVIDGKTYSHDVVITPTRIVSDWWRLEGHRLQLADIREYMLEEVDAVIIGTGYNGLMHVDNDVIKFFRRRGVDVYITRTQQAVEIYNRLVDQGRKVMAFLHLTC